MMSVLSVILAVLLDIIPGGDAYIRQLTARDSILIADQLEYGVVIDGVAEGEGYAFPDMKGLDSLGVVIVRDWQLDTLAAGKNASARPRRKGKGTGISGLRASVILAPFNEGKFMTGPLPVIRQRDTLVDTLVFNSVEFEVRTMPVDTATYVPHDIKGQMRYPLTAGEILPWLAGAVVLAGLVALLCMLIAGRRKQSAAEAHRDPAYIVALRKLEKYRSDRMWAPDKQKLFYSGVTDTLKEYIDERFGIDAPEMTTAELFDALKKSGELTPELYESTKDMFERADFVKFAKYIASDEDNAGTLPLAVRFVTSTWHSEEETEDGGEAAE